MKSICKTPALFIFGLFLLLATPPAVFAIDLSTAKAKGYVAENGNGYIKPIQADIPGDVRALIQEINNKRREKYQSIARKHNQPLEVIEKLAGEKLSRKGR